MSECPTSNEFGVRNNPVCVDSVNTSRFMNLDDITAAPDIRVSSLSHTHTHLFSLSLIILHLNNTLQALLEHISQEECAPYYITSTAGKLRGATD